MDRGAWRATVPGVAKESDTTEQLTQDIVKRPKEQVGRSWQTPLEAFKMHQWCISFTEFEMALKVQRLSCLMISLP